ncbi:hypothetical protein FRAHR75_1360002 [Frankia sp. Hr75.2]|nr:hypothetical protein FRAHR75_1360002 [Frankia sp. Hr75.2]
MDSTFIHCVRAKTFIPDDTLDKHTRPVGSRLRYDRTRHSARSLVDSPPTRM